MATSLPPTEEVIALTAESELIPTEPMEAAEYERASVFATTSKSIMTLDTPLSDLIVHEGLIQTGVRTLISPIVEGLDTSNTSYTTLTLSLPNSDADRPPEHTVLTVKQTAKDVRFQLSFRDRDDFRLPEVQCHLIYDPVADAQLLQNFTPNSVFVEVQSISHNNTNTSRYTVNNREVVTVTPGTWLLLVNSRPVLQFRILHKAMVYAMPQTTSTTTSTTTTGTNTTTAQLFVPEPQIVQYDSIQSRLSLKRTYEADLDDPCFDKSRSKKKPLSYITGGGIEVGDTVFMLPTSGSTNPANLHHGPLSSISTASEVQNERSSQVAHAVVLSGNAVEKLPSNMYLEMDQHDDYAGYRLLHLGPSDIHNSTLSRVFSGEYLSQLSSQLKSEFVLVKVLKVAPGAGDAHNRSVLQQIRTFIREVECMETLDHNHIPTFVSSDARYLAIFMTPYNAKNLGVRRRPGRDSLDSEAPYWCGEGNVFLGSREVAKEIIIGVANALDYLHQRGYVHNDVKPHNILYSPKLGPKLCDFGVVKKITDETESTAGTPWYIPPEYLARETRGIPGDVWALGVVMLYLLRIMPLPDTKFEWVIANTHRPIPVNPSKREEALTSREQARKAHMSWLNQVMRYRKQLNKSDVLHRVVWKMLEKDPERRISLKGVMEELTKGKEVAACV